MAQARNGRRQRRSSGHYTVDDLARRTGLTPRTIRSYQTQGLLPSPDRHGRVAYYDDSHLDRLDEIAELKEEGLSLGSIQDVLTRREAAARAKASKAKAKARAKDQPPSEPPGSKPGTSSGVAVPEPLRPNGVIRTGSSFGTGMTRVPTLAPAPDFKAADEDPESPRRRRGLFASVMVVLLLTVAAVSSVVAVFSLRDAAEDRKRLGRQVSDLRGDLSRLDVNQGPPMTVVVPDPTQPAPPSGAPPAPAPPATRTVIVTPPRQPAAPSSPPPASPPPASPQTTQPCTLSLLGRCVG